MSQKRHLPVKNKVGEAVKGKKENLFTKLKSEDICDKFSNIVIRESSTRSKGNPKLKRESNNLKSKKSLGVFRL